MRKIRSIINIFGTEFPRLYVWINCKILMGPSFHVYPPSLIVATAIKCFRLFSLNEELFIDVVLLMVIYLTLIFNHPKDSTRFMKLLKFSMSYGNSGSRDPSPNIYFFFLGRCWRFMTIPRSMQISLAYS